MIEMTDPLVRKKFKYVLTFFLVLEKSGFPFSYVGIIEQERLLDSPDETQVKTNFDNSLFYGANQSTLRQILYEL